MLRYAFGIKGNSVAAVILVIAGLVLEFISHGTNFLGSFFVVVLSMFCLLYTSQWLEMSKTP